MAVFQEPLKGPPAMVCLGPNLVETTPTFAKWTGKHCGGEAARGRHCRIAGWRATCEAVSMRMHPRTVAIVASVVLLGSAAIAWKMRDAQVASVPEASPAVSAPRRPPVDVANSRIAGAVRRIVETDDANGLHFLVIDKRDAELYVFAADGSPIGRTPVLLGSARGDHTVPGIGDRPIAQVRPEERTTPAGRFMGELGRNARNEDVVWVDYDAAVSIHRVLTTNRAERRMERLLSTTPDDNRISYGCINVLPEFYERYIRPEFLGRRAPIYILPEETTAAPG